MSIFDRMAEAAQRLLKGYERETVKEQSRQQNDPLGTAEHIGGGLFRTPGGGELSMGERARNLPTGAVLPTAVKQNFAVADSRPSIRQQRSRRRRILDVTGSKAIWVLKTYNRVNWRSRIFLYNGKERPLLVYEYQHNQLFETSCPGDILSIIGPVKMTPGPSGWSLQLALVNKRCNVNTASETWDPADYIDIRSNGDGVITSRRFSLSINNGAPVAREEPYPLGSRSWFGGFLHEHCAVNSGLGAPNSFDPLFESGTGASASTIGGNRILNGADLGDGPAGSYQIDLFQRQSVDPGSGVCNPSAPLFAGSLYVPLGANFDLSDVGEIDVDDTNNFDNAVVSETSWSGSFNFFGNTYPCTSSKFYRRLTWRRPDTAPSGACSVLGIAEPHAFQQHTGYAPVWMNPEGNKVLMCELDYTFENVDWAIGGTSVFDLNATTQRWFVLDEGGGETILGDTLFGINQGDIGPGWNVFGVPRNASTDEKFFTCVSGTDERFEFYRMFFLSSERTQLLSGTSGPYTKGVDLFVIDAAGETRTDNVEQVEYEGNALQYFSAELDPEDPFYLNPGGQEQLTIEGYFYSPNGWRGLRL